MYSGKKITREDTWRSEDLIKHIRSQEEESRRRERSHRDPERERRKHREESGRRGEERDEREKESRRERERDGGETEYRDREKERQREKYKDRDREKVKERDRDGLRERERVKERDREKDLEKEKRNREKDRDRNKERDREKDREKEKRDIEREKRDREKDREREKRDREKDRDRLREKERDRAREAVRDKGEERDREKDRERERRRAERENERRKEKAVSLHGEGRFREREKDRKERQREREHRRDGESHRGEEQEKERREQERREKHSHRQHTGQTDREERRERRREKEQHEDGATDRRHRHSQDGDGVKEREERDKQREQRHRENESKHRKTEHEVENEVMEDKREGAEDYGNEDYEDDFEEFDYEEDFEEFDEDKEEEEEEEVRETERREAERELSPRSRRELEAIQRAMEKENELVSSVNSTPSTRESEISHRASADSASRSRKSRTYGRVIDFTAARQREINQQAADKQKKRSAELLRLIDLDFSVTECLLDLPPVREYDLYIKSYGMANTKQAYVQCNEDNIERDTQTDETDVTDTWTQHPPETSVACGGPQVSQNASDESVTRTSVDSKRLAAFLRSATQVMAVLLEENISENNSVKKLQSETHTRTNSFSDGCVQLNTQLNLLQGRQVTLLRFSQTQTHTLLSVHSPRSGSSDVTLDSKTLICVWNIWEPSTPQRILVCEAEVRSCCFSPGKATLVFAGTDVGSVLVWDLREHSGSHSHIRVCEEEWTLRHPTFSTDAVMSGAGHFSSVVSVEPVLVSVGAGLRDPLLPDQEESLGLSFQLGSLDETGLLNLWVVVELPKADDSGSQTDLGLRPGGKVKLLHSSSLQTTPRLDMGVMGVTSHLSFVLKFLPSDSNHYFIGSNMALVRHGTRHGVRAFPKLYRPKEGERPAEVTALEFCPTGEPFFLVGCSDGWVRLHALACEEAVCEWAVGSGRGAVQCVQFSPTRCCVFCALDSASVLHIWDLTQRDESPLITHDLHADPVSATAVFGDAAKQNPYSGIALAKHSGRLEIHFLLPSLTLPQASDTEKLRSLAHDTL
ncbi:hypothetical protein PHYPO_G00189290 [Pangasianodon hypophthalmus]|uniref:WD repeat-containing protein 60 n=1 Tax=Pangasianodon hypophthalmus TaxID=310915 RepID=A0A5N5PH66_PANHP|nr:hypothetical protein PHYPO_G00189290 [Pangasianodon hypophthalmus]